MMLDSAGIPAETRPSLTRFLRLTFKSESIASSFLAGQYSRRAALAAREDQKKPSRRLFPRRVHRLADHERRIRARSRSELLGTTGVHFGYIEISLLIHAESVYSPETAGEISPRAPRIQEMPIEIVLEHF